jgi:hypothetical protein
VPSQQACSRWGCVRCGVAGSVTDLEVALQGEMGGHDQRRAAVRIPSAASALHRCQQQPQRRRRPAARRRPARRRPARRRPAQFWMTLRIARVVASVGAGRTPEAMLRAYHLA